MAAAWAALAGSAYGQTGDPTVYCTRQDQVFVSQFENSALLLGGLAAIFLLPVLVSLVRFNSWRLLQPRFRWCLFAGIAGLLVFLAFVALPVLATQRWVAPETGLLVYGGVQPDYLVRCESVKVSGTPVLGFLGDANTTAIGQPHYLVVAMALVFAGWTAAAWIAFRVARKRFGLRPAAR